MKDDSEGQGEALIQRLQDLAAFMPSDADSRMLREAADALSTSTQQQAELRALVEKWRNRARPNFADPEATEQTLDYWRGAQRCADELAALLSERPTP